MQSHPEAYACLRGRRAAVQHPSRDTRKNESKVACAVERPEMLIECCEEFDAIVNVLYAARLADAVHRPAGNPNVNSPDASECRDRGAYC